MKQVSLIQAALLISIFPAPGIFAEVSGQKVKVDQGFLLWKQGLDYRTQVHAEVSLENTKFSISFEDREDDAVGTQVKSLHYEGTMVYSTNVERASKHNGSAIRRFAKSDVTKIEASTAEIKLPASRWQALLAKLKSPIPKEWSDKLVRTETTVLGEDPHIRLESKSESDNYLVDMGILGAELQELEDLSETVFVLAWPSPTALKNAMLSVTPAELIDGKVVPVGQSVSPRVKDVLGRESKLLYEAMLGSGTDRKAGDVWEVSGEALAALIHPSMEGRFRGRAIVQAENAWNLSPHPLISSMTGLKLEFVKRGKIGGRTQDSDLTFEMRTTNGDWHTTRLMSSGGSIEGEIWLDAENQCVRYGKLTSRGTKYNGHLPKIGSLNDKDSSVRIEADLKFKFEYIQSISPEENPHRTPGNQ